jgi:hypothetical protein
MTIDGVWTAEVYGPFGWESIGILVFEKGRIVGGGNRHFSSGGYRFSENEVVAEIDVHYFGPPRTMFGETAESFSSVLTGKLTEETIEGTIKRPDRPHYELLVRLTRRMDLPPTRAAVQDSGEGN